MPLTENQASNVLSLMQSSTIEQKLAGIEESQKMFKDMFWEGMELGDYAKSAQIIENLYNIIRDELKQGFKQIVRKDLLEDEDIAPKAKKNGDKVKVIKQSKPAKVSFPKSDLDSEENKIDFLVSMLGMTVEEATAKIKGEKS